MAIALRYGLSFLLLISTGIAQGADDQAAFARWAASHAVRVEIADSDAGFEDLRPLESMIGTAHVLALGENMHGAHEPMVFRNRLFKFLVEQMGFTAIALESGFTESSLVDSFVGGAPGTTEDVTRKGLTSGFGRLEENRELIQWVRDYNAAASRKGRRRIHFYGIDLTGGAGRLGGPRRTLEYALTYLSKADPIAAQTLRVSLGESLPPSDDLQIGGLSAAAMQALQGCIDAVAGAMQSNRARLIAVSSEVEYRFATHNLDVARQLAGYLRLVGQMPGINDMSYAGPPMQSRDSAMAQNLEWIVQNEGSEGRVLVYAHDAHVMNWRLDGGIWSVIRDRPPMMGADLRSFYGKDLFILATSSASASAEFPRAETLSASVDSALASAGLSAMVLDIRAAQADPQATAWLSRPQPLGANISSHVLITPLTAVDGLFFVKRLTPSRSVPLSGRLLNVLDHYRIVAVALFVAAVLVGVALMVQWRRRLMTSSSRSSGDAYVR